MARSVLSCFYILFVLQKTICAKIDLFMFLVLGIRINKKSTLLGSYIHIYDQLVDLLVALHYNGSKKLILKNIQLIIFTKFNLIVLSVDTVYYFIYCTLMSFGVWCECCEAHCGRGKETNVKGKKKERIENNTS